MSGWLLDTNVLSELRKPRCVPAVRAWVEAQPPTRLHVSSITFAEIRYGIGRLTPEQPLRDELLAWLDMTLRPWFAGRVLELSEEALLTWRTMVEEGRQMRHSFGEPDLMIAAIARTRGLGVATRNVGHFSRTGVPVLNPWEA